MTLDRLLGNVLIDRKALILVDIEGAEYQMLQGAETTLRNHPAPIWMIEITVKTHQPFNITINPNLNVTFETFFSRCYRAFSVEGGRREITQLDIADWLKQKVSPPGHNFIFQQMNA